MKSTLFGKLRKAGFLPLFFALSLLCLTGCATPPPAYKPVEVRVPVSVPCKLPEIEKPLWPLQAARPESSFFEKVQAALIEIELRKGYETQLEAAAKACS